MSLLKTSLYLAAIKEVKTLAADQCSLTERIQPFPTKGTGGLYTEVFLTCTQYLRSCCLLVLRFCSQHPQSMSCTSLPVICCPVSLTFQMNPQPSWVCFRLECSGPGSQVRCFY